MMPQFHMTRLAPSPTGALHLGHARTFLVTWWLARRAGARIVMRMEDLDVGRAKPESVQQAYEDLRWLGIDWDPWAESGKLEVVQSERLALYRDALRRLWENDAIYPCTCSRADIAASVAGAASAPHAGEATPMYPGTCRTLGAQRRALRDIDAVERAVRYQTGKNVCWRLKVDSRVMHFEDLIAGPQAFDVALEVGDFPLTRFDGTPAYQLACVVDDHAMGMDLVVRGDDLLSSTPRQLHVYRALDYTPPQFAHVPLVVGTDGKRLAKRHGESRIAQFREAGVSPEKIVGWAAWRCGQIGALREATAREITALFDLQKLPRERVVLSESDLAWLRP